MNKTATKNIRRQQRAEAAPMAHERAKEASAERNEARLRTEPKRSASQPQRQAAERTRGPAATNGELRKGGADRKNIKDRKHADETQRATERDLAAIINTIPTTVWTTRPDGYCDFLNRVWLNYVGMTAEKAQGWGWTEAIHPEDRKRLVEH